MFSHGKVEGQHQASSPPDFSGSQPRGELGKPYVMPAITSLPNHLSLSNLQLGQNNILWTPITSAKVLLSLSLDTCHSLSLVSKAHADIICQKYPNLQFTKLKTPLPVAVATPDSQLKASGILQVPAVWETGKPCTFSMLVVPQLVWPFLFGQNHLDLIGAQTKHTKRTITFTDRDLHFTVVGPNRNPIELHPRLGPPNSISPGHGPSSAHVATFLCWLTSSPTPSQASEPIRLHSLVRGK